MGAKLSPFLSQPSELVERLAALKEERSKLEAAEDRIREKLKLIMQEKGVDHIDGSDHVVRLEKSEQLDKSEETLSKILHPEVWMKIKAQLPTKIIEKLVLRTNKEAADKKADENVEKIGDFFVGKKRRAE